MGRNFTEEDFNALLRKVHGKPFSEHLIRFSIKEEKIDLDAFNSREELEAYMAELKEFEATLEKVRQMRKAMENGTISS